jgi:hypothetical protein
VPTNVPCLILPFNSTCRILVEIHSYDGWLAPRVGEVHLTISSFGPRNEQCPSLIDRETVRWGIQHRASVEREKQLL